MSSIDISIEDWLYYRKNIGVEGLHITGLPGTGKSNMANLLAYYCLTEGEHLVLPGDRFCEWRHFEDYPKTCNLKVIIPSEKMCELKFHPKWLEEKDYFIRLDSYVDLDLEDYLTNKSTVLAIYDACFRIADRAKLWVYITEQLLNRFYCLDKSIIFLFHEAGNYWPEMARDTHWKSVDDFASLFVDCRKGLIRPVLISQLPAEVEHRIRDKCMVKVLRKGWGNKKMPPPLAESVPYTSINEYQYLYGGLYVRYNLVEEFKEKKISYKIIPRSYINGDSLPNSSSKTTQKYRLECPKCKYKWIPKVLFPVKCPNPYCQYKFDYPKVIE